MGDSDSAGGDSQKRGRGRPRKSDARNDSKDVASSDEPKAKKLRGRPKTAAKATTKSASNPKSGKKGRGRPRKSDAGASKKSNKAADAGDDDIEESE